MSRKSLIMVIFFGLIAQISHAQPISSTDLINNAKHYDSKIVDYGGEVIGDIMIRGRFAWVNINDGQNAIGIYATTDLIKDITHRGGYAFKGDIVEVAGIFHRSCPEHGGDLDIHAQTIRRVRSGEEIKEGADPNKVKIAFILLGVALLFYLLTKVASFARIG